MMTEEEKKKVEELEDKIMCYLAELDEEIWDMNNYLELSRLKGYMDGLRWALNNINEIWYEDNLKIENECEEVCQKDYLSGKIKLDSKNCLCEGDY